MNNQALAKTLVICVVAQKGGVGKSFLSRLIAREFAAASWLTKIADLDISQGTSTNWKRRREQNQFVPEVAVEPFRTIEQALRVADAYNLLVVDTPPYSTQATLDIARHSNFSFIPTGLSLDDLEPSVLLAHEMSENAISSKKIAFVLSRVGDSENEILEARNYIQRAGYKVLDGELPEKTSYRRAIDMGKAPTEVSHPSIKKRAEKVAQSVIDFVFTNLSKDFSKQLQEVISYGN